MSMLIEEKKSKGRVLKMINVDKSIKMKTEEHYTNRSGWLRAWLKPAKGCLKDLLLGNCCHVDDRFSWLYFWSKNDLVFKRIKSVNLCYSYAHAIKFMNNLDSFDHIA
jgi:hypothetical protein